MKRLGRYTLIERLGAGGMAEIYVARRAGALGLSELKLLQPELRSHPTGAARFFREAHVASLLDHPNIARVLGASEEEGAFCIEMELIAGVNLEELGASFSGRGALVPAPVVTSIALSALAGLDHAHEARGTDGARLALVHRDLSPRNVMVDLEGRPKLIDFGVARAELDSFKTAPGMIVGSLRYFSPEQARAEPVDARSDLYSLSVTLFELFTGRERVASRLRPIDVLLAVSEDPAPLVSDLAPVPRAVAEVLARGLAKAADDRWPSAAAYRAALADAAASAGLAVSTERALRALVSGGFPERRAALERWAAIGRELAAAEGQAEPAALFATGSELEVGESGEALVTRAGDGGSIETTAPEIFGLDELGPEATRVRTRIEETVHTEVAGLEPTYVPSEVTDPAPERRRPSRALVAPRPAWLGALRNVALLALGAGGMYVYLRRSPAPDAVIVVPPPVAEAPRVHAEPQAAPTPLAPLPTPAPTPDPEPARRGPTRRGPKAVAGRPVPAPAGPAAPLPRPAASAPEPAAPVDPVAELEGRLNALAEKDDLAALQQALEERIARLPPGEARERCARELLQSRTGGGMRRARLAVEALIKALRQP